ncbi:NAD(P)-dependent oxidoreductase [Mycobacterium sp. E796]|uniref:NAD-dependent epimerase/dehydratase family protein n=1 Tax=Mycobacterium sp. E796 TaxID=1834151 RepID=UPI0007FD8429|nr:NAD(P)-dependent oxidoreductase [Mycobacterium sp. E796]OBI67843.1 epimerase [Mycobacterium sp. E796]
MTVLVTGATGLVGARLLPRLVDDGVDCRALVREGSTVPDGVTPAWGDLLQPESLAPAMENVSAVIHLAAVFRTNDTDLIWKANLVGSRNLIAATRTHAPRARFIMASTGQVYDHDSPHPGRENDAAEPKLAYPASKLAAENELRSSGLTWSIHRYGFVYGDQDGHLQSLSELAANASFHPAQRMSMVHHRDIATATKLALAGALDGRIVNIVDEAPTSIYELVQLIGGAMRPSSQPLENPWRLHMDGTLARHLGFQPAVRTVYQAAQENSL